MSFIIIYLLSVVVSLMICGTLVVHRREEDPASQRDIAIYGFLSFCPVVNTFVALIGIATAILLLFIDPNKHT